MGHNINNMSAKYANGDDMSHWVIGKPHASAATEWDTGLVIPDGKPWLVLPPHASSGDDDQLSWFATWQEAWDHVGLSLAHQRRAIAQRIPR